MTIADLVGHNNNTAVNPKHILEEIANATGYDPTDTSFEDKLDKMIQS